MILKSYVIFLYKIKIKYPHRFAENFIYRLALISTFIAISSSSNASDYERTSD